MLLAINDINSNDRILPYKGGKALCPFCKKAVIAICGEIYVHHWRHEIEANCDSWKEAETEWHRKWKEKFPEEWREFIISKNGERHIADIRTDFGLIVEFQNSSISSTTINIRETFYKNMVWLINAKKFKQNFKIKSLVKTYLRLIEKPTQQNCSPILDIAEEDLNKIKSELVTIENDVEEIRREINTLNADYEYYTGLLSNVNHSIYEILSSSNSFGLLRYFKSKNIGLINELKNKLEVIERKIIEKEKKLLYINKLPNIEIPSYENYKIISFDIVDPGHFNQCCVVKVNTLNTFFSQVIKLYSESDFRWYYTKKTEFILIIDLTEKSIQLKKEIDLFNRQINNIETDIKSKRLLLNTEFENWLNAKLKNISKQLKELQEKELEHNSSIVELNAKLNEETNRLIKIKSDLKTEQEKEEKRERTKIMKEYKGLYSYYWKHRRKSWDYAKCKIFLDFEDYIFELLSNNQMKKISKLEFIDLLKTGGNSGS